ncbi:MAG: electron transfer flavoprotein subunit beta/FixA family protein [Rhodothermales bacterium]
MKFCVCIKQVPDVQATVQTGRMVLNAYDASAVEEALVLNEPTGDPVDLVLVGGPGATETIRKALAMGATGATHLVTEDATDSHAVALLLSDHFSQADYDVILTGKQSQDSDAGLAGSMLAARLDLPYATNAVGLAIEGEKLIVTRQGDVGQEVIALETPCVVTCSNDMNNPRIPALKGIMAAKRKPITTVEATLPEPRTVVGATMDPPSREPGVKLEGEPEEMVADLVRRLDAEAGVI